MKKALAILATAALLGGGLAVLGVAEDTKAERKPAPGGAAQNSKDARRLAGTIKSGAPDRIVVSARGKEWTFAVDAKTAITREGSAVSATDVKAGETVRVWYTTQDGKMVAQRVAVRPGDAAGRMSNPGAAQKPANPCAPKR